MVVYITNCIIKINDDDLVYTDTPSFTIDVGPPHIININSPKTEEVKG